MGNILLPHNFTPRDYQLPVLQAMDSGYKRGVCVWHRRAGKEKTFLNYQIREMYHRVGYYPYFFPTFKQGRKVLWNGADKAGFRFMDHFPKEIIKRKNDTEMLVELKNGSIWQLIGTDNYDAMMGSNPIGCIFSEFSLQDPMAWEFLRPILMENDGWALFNFTPRGYNHAKELYDMAVANDKWFCQMLTVDDTGVLTAEQLDEERKAGMSEEKMQQEFWCFPGDTDVITQDEVKEIQNIEVGDFVLTHTNRFRKVKKVYKRYYSGKLLKIKTLGSAQDILCTPEHPIRVCNDGVNNSWKAASQITTKDRLTFPKRCQRKITYISEAMAKLIAWYVAEGSINEGSVQFTLNKTEKKYIKEIKNISTEIGCNYTITEKERDNTTSIHVNSRELVEFMVVNCGSGAINKRIPLELISGHEKAVYKTLMDGDGHRHRSTRKNKKKGKRDIYTTISKTLAYQFQLLAHQLGYKATLKKRSEGGKAIILGREVVVRDSYLVSVYFTRNIYKYEKIKSHKYNVSVPVVSIEEEDYEGYVYNLNVAYDESYTANGRVVHNCSFESGMPGAYYSNEMKRAREDKRICKVPYSRGSAVDTYWDLGINDSTTIWFAQIIGREIHLIDYYENSGEGLDHYVRVLKDKQGQGFDYSYGRHVLPHDGAKRELGPGKSIREQLIDMGLRNVHITRKPKRKEMAIELVRQVLGICWFDMEKCKRGINALQQYRKDYDEKNKIFSSRPVHDWSSHGADAFSTLALSSPLSFRNRGRSENSQRYGQSTGAVSDAKGWT